MSTPRLPGAGAPSAHVDHFARDRLPPQDLWPVMDFSTLPALAAYPDRLNAADVFVDERVRQGDGDRPCLFFNEEVWSYRRLQETIDRLAKVLVGHYGIRPGQRVLLRAPNNPMMVAAHFAVLKVGAIYIATMPLLRARELAFIVEACEIDLALSDIKLAEEIVAAQARAPGLTRIGLFTATGAGDHPDANLDRLMAAETPGFQAVDTSADDIALIAFTSGTTGQPKGTVHFHRDMLAIADCFPPHIFGIRRDDVMVGSPPLAFTFGLGALVLFPMRVGAASVLLEKFSPEILLETVQRQRCTAIYTAPTGYRQMADLAGRFDLSSLTHCVSAGEHLPKPTFELWADRTGLKIIDGLGSTEMLHIFVSSSGDGIRVGATGRAIPGYQACILGPDGQPVPDGDIGRLAVRGPTGCRYLNNLERQQAYVQQGWNITGDVYVRDSDGYFWYQARNDDMIISAGYNIAGPEVESVLLDHPLVKECAVIGAPDADRGQVVKAFVVLRDPAAEGPETVALLQDWVKREIAPFKYPRRIEFRSTLPRTETGKLQRFRLREEERST
ncbi:MAG: 2-aminobenzoate-CoA ligase [Alphaproteobacteria bacterium]|nr:AMP-binding protein [Alphaproteobacteria bacterium]TAD89535.1 MAG: 2-aminobenzoate-CoA ligase [Alphaproteobacteria bacterium]